MKLINRCAVIIVPKKPYFEWAAGIDDDARSHASELGRSPPSLYLIGSQKSAESDVVLSDETARHIFEAELAAWHDDAVDWPRARDLKNLLKWFDVQIQEMVIDLGDRILDLEHI